MRHRPEEGLSPMGTVPNGVAYPPPGLI
jgi:hypothetical protein